MGLLDFYDVWKYDNPKVGIQPIKTDVKIKKDMPRKQEEGVTPKDPNKGGEVDTYAKPFKDVLKEVMKKAVDERLVKIADGCDEQGYAEHAATIDKILDEWEQGL